MQEPKIKFMAAYLSLNRDYHKNTQIEPNDYEYIREYCDSITKNDCRAVILMDTLSHEFMKRYSTKNINLCTIDKNDIDPNILIHDARFFYFLDYIKKDTSTEYFMLSDVSDVTLLNKPQNVIKLEKNKLYICRENQFINENEWFLKYVDKMPFLKCFDYEEKFTNKTLLNCGVIFGHRDIIIKLLEMVTMCMKKVYSKKSTNIQILKPLDMFVINYVIYTYFSKFLYDNNDFNTKFGHYELDSTKVVKHK